MFWIGDEPIIGVNALLQKLNVTMHVLMKARKQNPGTSFECAGSKVLWRSMMMMMMFIGT